MGFVPYCMTKIPEHRQNESDMRAFYESIGMNRETIDRAVEARRKKPIALESKLPTKSEAPRNR